MVIREARARGEQDKQLISVRRGDAHYIDAILSAAGDERVAFRGRYAEQVNVSKSGVPRDWWGIRDHHVSVQ